MTCTINFLCQGNIQEYVIKRSFYFKNHLSCNHRQNQSLCALSTFVHKTRSFYVQIFICHTTSRVHHHFVGHDKKKSKRISLGRFYMNVIVTYCSGRTILPFYACSLFFFSSLLLLVLLNQSSNTNRYRRFNESSTKTLQYVVDYRCKGRIILLNEGCLISSVKQSCLTYSLKSFV
jgi:hypothetical protein